MLDAYTLFTEISAARHAMCPFALLTSARHFSLLFVSYTFFHTIQQQTLSQRWENRSLSDWHPHPDVSQTFHLRMYTKLLYKSLHTCTRIHV